MRLYWRLYDRAKQEDKRTTCSAPLGSRRVAQMHLRWPVRPNRPNADAHWAILWFITHSMSVQWRELSHAAW